MIQIINLPPLRFGFASSCAIVITFFLFFLMQYLIENTGMTVLDDSESLYFLDFVRVIDDSDQVRPHDEEIVEPPVPPPPLIEFVDQEKIKPGETTINIPVITVPTTIPTDELFIPAANADALSIVDVQPVYPRIAIARNIEGFVIVEFSVTASGTTEGIHVIEAEPDRIFNKSAISAAAKSRYKPRMVNGKATAVTGMRKMYTFNLED